MGKKLLIRLFIPSVILTFVIITVIGLNSKNINTVTQSGWVLQTNLQTLLNGRTVNDMTFLDSLTGFAVSNNKSPGDTGYIYKTTNGGSNWFVSFMPLKNFSKIKFINDSIGYACGGSGGGTSYFCKTTDRGNTWIGSSYGASYFSGMSVLSKDTIFICDNDSFVGGLFRTTNGGTNWQQIYSAGIYNPADIYMYNARIGFYQQGDLYKTTDGGFNWTHIDVNGFYDIKFIDSLTGYRAIGNIQKTTNGGLNWVTQVMPIVHGIPYTSTDLTRKLFLLNKDTIWAIGNVIWYSGIYRGLINKTTNGGVDWGYQLPDTNNIHIVVYNFNNFYNDKIGWLYDGFGKGIHTNTGGDSTLYTNINEQIKNLSLDFMLYQNYPNPFNPITNIKIKMNKRGFAELKIFDITGKLKDLLINRYENAGEYIYKFDAKELSSGVYFYSLFVDGMRVDTKKLILIK